MAARGHTRGHAMEYRDGRWVYSDTGEPVASNPRPCGHCGRDDTPEGHDGCLGTLPGVRNACCGHGGYEDAYIQYTDGVWVGGVDAVLEMIRLGVRFK